MMTMIQMTPQQVLKDLISQGKISDKDLTFATSLANAKRTSEKQEYWINELIKRATTPAPAKAPAARLDVSGIVTLFDTAAQHLKAPRVRLRLADGSEITLNRAGVRSKHAGTVFIDRGSFDSGLAKITPSGDLVLYRAGEQVRADLVALLSAFAADPAGTAAAYGRTTGACCFCSKELTDKRSTDVGYGPVCAGKFGLVWG